MNRVVIVGGGQAALSVAVTLRQRGYEGTVTMLCGEPLLPYQRPPLSKTYLWDEPDPEKLSFRAPEFYSEKLDIDARVGVSATAVDRAAKRVDLADGASLEYDSLVFATGARPQRLGLPGEELERVHVLRTAADADRLRDRLRPGAHLAVIGGGYLGLEVAAAATRMGAKVTVLEALPRVMSRVTGERVASFLTETHRSHGVEVLTEAAARELLAEGGGVRIALADGRALACDEVLVAVGVVPIVELAEASGLACENGIVVDENARTEDPAIFAAGDCTNHPNPLLGRRLRLESVHNAVEQAKAAAAAIVGSPAPYGQVPWFYSDQYDIKLQTVGLFQGADRELVHGSPQSGEFSVLYLAGDRIVAVDAINHSRAFVLGRKLLGESPDGTVPLAEWPDGNGDPQTSAPVTMPA